VIVLDEFHRFVEHTQQAFLYFLLDSLSLAPPINAMVIGCSPMLVLLPTRTHGVATLRRAPT